MGNFTQVLRGRFADLQLERQARKDAEPRFKVDRGKPTKYKDALGTSINIGDEVIHFSTYSSGGVTQKFIVVGETPKLLRVFSLRHASAKQEFTQGFPKSALTNIPPYNVVRTGETYEQD